MREETPDRVLPFVSKGGGAFGLTFWGAFTRHDGQGARLMPRPE